MVRLFRLEESHKGKSYQGDECYQAVVPIGLNEVVTCYGKRVDVMLSKWTNECLQNRKSMACD